MSGRHQRTIAFTLNGRRVTANAATHETILEVLQVSSMLAFRSAIALSWM